MSEAGGGSINRKRIVALLAVAALIVVPIVWIVWSLNAASLANAATESQAVLLQNLRTRLADLGERPGAQAIVNADSIYLPGETNAIAGATLQRMVAEKIEAEGGRLVESELGIGETEETAPGQVSLRVSFETEIEGLQRIIFELETGTPILMIEGLDVRSVDTTELPATESPTLRVVMLVEAHREAEAAAAPVDEG